MQQGIHPVYKETTVLARGNVTGNPRNQRDFIWRSKLFHLLSVLHGQVIKLFRQLKAARSPSISNKKKRKTSDSGSPANCTTIRSVFVRFSSCSIYHPVGQAVIEGVMRCVPSPRPLFPPLPQAF